MTAQAVASVPKHMPPPRVPDPTTVAINDFAQLLGDAAALSPTPSSTSSANNTGGASGTAANGSSANGRVSKKGDDDTSSAANLLTALQLPLPSAQSKTPVQGSSTAIEPLLTKAGDNAADASNGTSTAGDADIHPGASGAAAAAGSSLPGSGTMDGRVTTGLPSYFSQPNAMLTGGPHPATAASNATTDSDDDDGGDTAPSNEAPTLDGSTTANSPAKVNAPSDVATIAQLHDASHADASAGTTADPASQADPTSTPSPSDTTVLPPVANDGRIPAPTAMGTSSAGVAPTLAPPPIFEQVAFTLRQAADGDGGVNTINIQLKPASLGAIQVKLDVDHDGKISAVISADRSDTLNLLRQDSQGLEQALRDAGLKADSGSLSFNLRGEQQAFSQAPSGGSTAPSMAPQSSRLTGADIPAPRYSRHLGALDIEV